MSDTPAKPISDTKGKDKEALISIVKEMTESMTGAHSTRHWAEDALWFDIPPFASRGIQPATKFFDRVFGSFQSCNVDILETDVVVNGNMGLVCTIQRSVVLKTGDAKRLMVRETDEAGQLREVLSPAQTGDSPQDWVLGTNHPDEDEADDQICQLGGASPTGTG